jgi:FOG: EAL domain
VEHRFELAFDDFGAGQSRLSELADISVHYVKFDIALIRGLPDAGPAKQTLVSSLCDMTRAMGVKVLAEGVETVREFELCREMKFDLIQGYYFGKPKDDLSYQNPLKRTR